jgi:hypothetical protein
VLSLLNKELLDKLVRYCVVLKKVEELFGLTNSFLIAKEVELKICTPDND